MSKAQKKSAKKSSAKKSPIVESESAAYRERLAAGDVQNREGSAKGFLKIVYAKARLTGAKLDHKAALALVLKEGASLVSQTGEPPKDSSMRAWARDWKLQHESGTLLSGLNQEARDSIARIAPKIKKAQGFQAPAA